MNDILDYLQCLFNAWKFLAEKDGQLLEKDIVGEELAFNDYYKDIEKRLKLLNLILTKRINVTTVDCIEDDESYYNCSKAFAHKITHEEFLAIKEMLEDK